MPKTYGLIGFPLSHSFSPGYFAAKFKKESIPNTAYELFPLEDIRKIKSLLKNRPDLLGLNVTIPHKEAVIPFLDHLSEAAAEIGAVNTIKIYREGKEIKLKGFNTDVFGFEQGLLQNHIPIPQSALILGTGGAAKAAEWVLSKNACRVVYVSRNPQKINSLTYEQLRKENMQDFPLIVNSTPLGMYPNIEQCPDIPYEKLNSKHVLYDLIYNPEETLFLNKGKERGCITLNGLLMLQQQAEKAWEIWSDGAY